MVGGIVCTRMLECAGIRRASQVTMWTSGSGRSRGSDLVPDSPYRSSEMLMATVGLVSISKERDRERQRYYE